LPGNFGRILNSYKVPITADNAIMLARELAFETVRATKWKELPSRFSSCFVFETLNDVITYQHEFTPWNAIYEVKILDENTPVHRGDFNLVKFPALQQGQIYAFMEWAIRTAESYWHGEEIGTPELLTTSPISVVQMVNSGPKIFHP
jgi:hypothetical protein